MLELTVKMININLPVGHKILKECMPLYEYAWFVEKIREYLDLGKSRDTAIALAIQDCIREGIFAEFVEKHGSEVENMLFTQFNMDDALAVRYEEGVEDGLERGIEQGIERGIVTGKTESILELLEDLGPVPEELREDICAITDMETIRKLHKLAAKAGSLEEFEKNVHDILE